MQKIDLFFAGKSGTIHAIKEKEISCTIHAEINLNSVKNLRNIVFTTTNDYFLLFTKSYLPLFSQYALERMIQIAEDSRAGLVYTDYHEIKDGIRKAHPLNDYQTGSIRDDFDFGPLLLIRTEAAKKSLQGEKMDYQYAALYDLRLKISQEYPLIHLNEFVYTLEENDLRKSDEKMFAYVDPKNRTVQIEMEQACTEHLKAISAWLPPVFENIDLSEGSFPVEASVIIPVRNRIRTIKDAIDSVLSQKTNFPFNLIIIDNHSTDGTTEVIAQKTSKDKRIIHLIPEREDLGIGGCWNEGVQHPECGRFAIQLDSDDVYSDENTLSRIVQEFYTQHCAMLIGSYRMCNFDLQTIPPGIIDHKEWTPENGRNNALRINGLGAPRAFFTLALRKIKVPNTSYGEDYALGLQFSRKWQIGRIYDVLYLCRRWDDNSDAALDITKLNANNAYKDKLRSIEISARQRLNI
jgi:hypothetical protein